MNKGRQQSHGSDNSPVPSKTESQSHEVLPQDESVVVAELVDEFSSADSFPALSPSDLRSPRPRRIALPVVLFVVTCVSTFWAGVSNWMPTLAAPSSELTRSVTSSNLEAYGLELRMAILRNSTQGFIYMICVLAILLTHEMGHFLATLRHRIPASLPYFIPFPISSIGTMGAVIGMEGFRANRRQMFDIGVAGPIAGLLVAIPILCVGITNLDLNSPRYGGIAFECPWLVKLLIGQLRPDLNNVDKVWISQLNPFYMAGWVGLLITGLNMLPISQLDGGHVIYTLFQRKSHLIARGFLIFAIVCIIWYDAYMWTLMLLLVTLIGTDHPPTSNDNMTLGKWRTIIGFASLMIPILCFPINAISLGG